MRLLTSTRTTLHQYGLPVYSSRRARPRVLLRAMPDFGDMLRQITDFGSWAPKSTRIWRLQRFEYESTPADEVDELEQKINRLQSLNQVPPHSTDSSLTATSTGVSQTDDDDSLPTKSFSDAADSELAQALSARIQTIAASSADSLDVLDEEDEVTPLSGNELRRLIFAKYGKTYDVSFVRRDIPGKTFVCLNIMWQHLEQRSFKMSEAQYMDKIDSVAYMVNVLGQTTKVRSFLKAVARSQKGLPKRPVVGTAISIQLDLGREMIQEFFGAGYQ